MVAERRPVTAEDLLRFELAGDVQITRATDRVAYVTSKVNPENNRYDSSIYMSVAGAPGFRFTGGDGDRSPRFSPDGATLAFCSKRSGQPQIWLMPVNGGEARQLTRVEGGAGQFAWSPDGQRIAFYANKVKPGEGLKPEVKPEAADEKDLFKKHTAGVKVITELFHKLDGEGWYGEERAQICVIDVADGAEPRLLTEGPYHRSDLQWSPDGRYLFYSANEEPDYDREIIRSDLYAVPVSGGPTLRVTAGAWSASRPAPSPDGKWLACTGADPAQLGYDNTGLFVIPLDPAAWPVPALRQVAASLDRPWENVSTADLVGPASSPLLWSPDSRYLFSLCSSGGTTHVLRADTQTGDVSEVTHGDRVVYSYSLSAGGDQLVYAVCEPTNPSQVFLADLKTGAERLLAAPCAALLEELTVSVPQRFQARAHNGPEIDGWLIKPANWEPGKTYPAVLEIHGGPMGQYAAMFHLEFQCLASQGYAVIYGNPRGSLGYGQEFCAAIRHQWGDKDYADVMATLDQALADHPWIDSRRLGVAGGSYGGYMTNWTVSHTDRFRAAVTMRSVCDWRQMAGTGDVAHEWFKDAGGAPYWRDDTWYKQQSPITYVENIVTPLLIEHQEGDLRCPIDQGEALYAAVKWLGKAPVKFVRYPDEFHGMSRDGKPWHRIHRLKLIGDWFNEYLQAKA